MNTLMLALERASLFGLAGLVFALGAQFVLDGRVPAAWRVWMWRVVVVQSALAMLLFPVAPLQLAVLPPRPVVETLQTPAPATIEALATSPNATAVAREAANAQAIEPQYETTLAESPPFQSVGLAVYGLGLSVQLTLLTHFFWRTRRLLGACLPFEDDASRAPIGPLMTNLARRMQIPHLPRLLVSEGGAPCLIGVFRPAMVLPRSLLSPCNAELEAVLSHELAHLKRRDLAWNAALWAMQALLWFHPLTWISRRFLTLETESACDEMTLSSTPISPQSYGALLLNTMKTPHNPLTAGVADGFFALKTRLLRLNHRPKAPRRAAKWLFAATLCLALAALIPLRFVARAQNESSDLSTSRAATKTDAARPIIARIGIVNGRVLTPSGEPVRSARVSWVGYGAGNWMSAGQVLAAVPTDAQGRFRFANSAALLTRSLHFSGLAMEGIAPQLLVEAPNWGVSGAHILADKPKPLEIRLAPATSLQATFVNSLGQSVPNLRVRLSGLMFGKPGGSTPWNFFISPRDVKLFTAVTDAQGSCRFTGLPQGVEARLEVDDERFAQLDYQTGNFKLGGNVTIAPPTRLVAGASARGRITSESGQPVAGVRIGAQGTGSGTGWGEAISDRNGYFQMNSLAAGNYNVALSLRSPMSDDWTARAHENVAVTTGQTLQNLDFQLERGALIKGRVTAQGSAQPIGGLMIGIYGPAHPRSGAWVQGATSAPDGTYQLRVPGGEQMIYIMSQSPAGFGPPPQKTHDITVRDGQTLKFDWQLPKTPAGQPRSRPKKLSK